MGKIYGQNRRTFVKKYYLCTNQRDKQIPRKSLGSKSNRQSVGGYFFFYYLCGTTRTHGSYFFWLINASAGGMALPPAFFLCKIWIYKKRFVFLRKRLKMKIFDYFKPRHTFLKDNGYTQCWQLEERRNFGRLVWVNAVELLTNLCNDVTFVYTGSELVKFAEFKVFFANQAEIVLQRYFSQGYCVIAYTGLSFKLLDEDEYKVVNTRRDKRIEPKNPKYTIYVMRSPSYSEFQQSDRELAKPALELIDNALNASNTCSARLGSLIVASPATPNAVPTPMILTEEQKNQLEKEIAKEYGGLSSQKQLMVLKRGMNFQVVSLAGIDARTAEKVRMGVCLVADRLKIPANQIAILDANSNKTLANGSELREGDHNKYQTFERLLNRTFVQMASECGLDVNYIIYNKPVRGA